MGMIKSSGWTKHRALAVIAPVLVLGCAALAEDAPASRPAEPAPAPKAVTSSSSSSSSSTASPSAAALSNKALQVAISGLKKEFDDWKRSPANGHLRTESNYFADNPSPDVTPTLIIASLTRRLDSNADVDSYVKWQLLSAITGRVDAQDAPGLLKAYRSAAVIAPNPGLRKAELKAAISRPPFIGPRAELLAGKVNADFKVAVQAVRDANRPILNYRAALFSHLPISGAALEAGMADVEMRVLRGDDARGFWDVYQHTAESWAQDIATPAEMESLAVTVQKLRKGMDDDAVKVYSEVEYNDKDKKLNWRDFTALDGRTLDDFVKELYALSINPPAHLDFKKDPGK